MNFKVVDEHGRQLAMGRNLAQLRAELGAQAQSSFRAAAVADTAVAVAPACTRTSRTGTSAHLPSCSRSGRADRRWSGIRHWSIAGDPARSRCSTIRPTRRARSIATGCAVCSGCNCGSSSSSSRRALNIAAADADAGRDRARAGDGAARFRGAEGPGDRRRDRPHAAWSSPGRPTVRASSRARTKRAQAEPDRAGDRAPAGDDRGRGGRAPEEAEWQSAASRRPSPTSNSSWRVCSRAASSSIRRRRSSRTIRAI